LRVSFPLLALPFRVHLNSAAALVARGVRISLWDFALYSQPSPSSEAFFYHGARLSTSRGIDVNVSGIVDVEWFTSGLLVFCVCNSVIVGG